jgi:PTH1 family peptidyl-tRNA hydrolase
MIAGLGNPGRAYARTRHNAGFEVLDALGGRLGAQWRRSWRWPVETAEVEAGGGKVLLVKPRTFMNASGPPVAALARKKGFASEDVMVVYDDVDLPVGQLRMRKKGSAGGHNGLKSVIASLGTEGFPRLRVGVGRPAGSGDMVDHVLSTFTPEERKTMEEAVGRAADALERAVSDGLDRAMNEFNG